MEPTVDAAYRNFVVRWELNIVRRIKARWRILMASGGAQPWSPDGVQSPYMNETSFGLIGSPAEGARVTFWRSTATSLMMIGVESDINSVAVATRIPAIALPEWQAIVPVVRGPTVARVLKSNP